MNNGTYPLVIDQKQSNCRSNGVTGFTAKGPHKLQSMRDLSVLGVSELRLQSFRNPKPGLQKSEAQPL